MADDLDLAALRPLFDDLHGAAEAAITAMREGDMQAWLDHAARGAELHEEIAVRLGWRETPRD